MSKCQRQYAGLDRCVRSFTQILRPAEPRYGHAISRPEALRLIHHIVEGSLKALHFGACSDRNADVGWQRWKDTADKNVSLSHRIDDLSCRPFCLDHEEVGLRRSIGKAFLIEPLEQILANASINLLALRHEIRFLKARGGCSRGGYWHVSGTAVNLHLSEKVRPCDSKSATQPCHSIDLRERTQDDHIFV